MPLVVEVVQELKSILSRTMSKCRTRQLALCDTISLCLAQEGRANAVSKRSEIERWLAYGIEVWSVVQQLVSFSSDKNESYATRKSKADR